MLPGLVSAPVLTYDRALAAARRAFLKKSNIDMQALAEDLAVSRATLYRVAGSRDRLLGDVIWSFGQVTLHRAQAEATQSGLERLVEIARRFNEYVVGFQPLREFLESDPVAALRILFTSAGGVHGRFVAAWRMIFEEARSTGEVDFQLPVEDAAYVFVRIGESMLYSDLLADRKPDIDLAARVQYAVLRSRD